METEKTKLDIVKNLCKDINQLKTEMAQEKALWERELSFENIHPILKPVSPTIIQEFENKLSRYERALAEARAENRANRRRLNDIFGHSLDRTLSDNEYHDAQETQD